MTRDPHDNPDQPPTPPWPVRQTYFVTVEWLDAPHQPESPERLAQAIRHLIEHAHHQQPPGADASPARFAVRVKADEVASEVTGTLTPHHHHHHQQQP